MDGDLVRVGVLGCGNVGGALVQLVEEHGDAIAERTGLRLQVARVAVHNTAKERAVEFAPGVLTHDAADVVAAPGIPAVGEAICWTEPSAHLRLSAPSRC